MAITHFEGPIEQGILHTILVLYGSLGHGAATGGSLWEQTVSEYQRYCYGGVVDARQYFGRDRDPRWNSAR